MMREHHRKSIMDGHEITISLSPKFCGHIQNSEVITGPEVGNVHIVDIMFLREVIICEVMNHKHLKVMKKRTPLDKFAVNNFISLLLC
jgi:hypothetical protein